MKLIMSLERAKLEPAQADSLLRHAQHAWHVHGPILVQG